jgi:hypothetical protein
VVKLNFNQRQKQYERRRSKNRASLFEKEFTQFTYSPRINRKSRNMAKKSQRVPLTERGRQGENRPIRDLSASEQFIKFYEDTHVSPNKELVSRAEEYILQTPTKRVMTKRDKVQNCMNRLYKTPGKENRPEYILASVPQIRDQSAVVIKEY